MSIQHPTPPSFLRSVPLVVVVVGLGALIWSCESEQTGYEVTLPLIGPIDFNETSCDVSGDICSTDNDCFDEDGFDVGPCTKTMKAIEPITYEVRLGPDSPTYTLPPLANTADWASLLAALPNEEDGGIVFASDNFSLPGGPIDLSVRPTSRNGLYFGRDAGYNPYGPGMPSIASCDFRVASEQDYTDGIITCLRDFVTEHGAPLAFDIQVTASAPGAAVASAAQESDFALKQNLWVSAGDSWTTLVDCPVQTDTELLEAAGEGSDFFDLLTCSGLELRGDGTTSDPITLYGLATVYDACGASRTARLGNSLGDRYPLAAGNYTVVVGQEGDTFETTGDSVPVVFSPGPGEFLEHFFNAAAGKCTSGDDPPGGGEGSASVTWTHCYNGPPPAPDSRTGALEVTAQGFCPVSGDSSDGGTDDGGTGDGGTGDGGTGEGSGL